MGVVNDFIVTALVFFKDKFILYFVPRSFTYTLRNMPPWKRNSFEYPTTSFVIIQHVTACFRGWILPIFPWEWRGTPPMGGGCHWVPLDSHDFFVWKQKPEVRESFLEECDIGNVLTEGCDSTTCRVLPGYTCNKVGDEQTAALFLFVFSREFHGRSISGTGPPDNDVRCNMHPTFYGGKPENHRL